MPRGPMSEETKRKLSVAMTGKTHTPEVRERLREMMTGRKMDESARQKLSASLQATYAARREQKNGEVPAPAEEVKDEEEVKTEPEDKQVDFFGEAPKPKTKSSRKKGL